VVKAVLDTSVFMRWTEPEKEPRAVAMRHYVAQFGAIVPGLFRVEVQNALRSALLSKSVPLGEERLAHALELASMFPIEVEPGPPALALGAELAVARRYDLTVYDAAYLELALRLNLPLMTFDQELERAAQAVGLLWTTHTRGISPLLPDLRVTRSRRRSRALA